MGCAELVQEQPAIEAGEHAYGQEEAGPTGDPLLTVWRQVATGHDAMDVWMMRERLPPGMQHHRRADLGAEVFGIGSDRLQRRGGGLEQQRIDDGLVLVGDGRDRRRQRENDMEILDRQQVGLPRFEPFAGCTGLTLPAVPVATGVVGNGRVPTIAATRDVAAEGGRPTCLYCSHHAPLTAIEMAGIAGTISIAMAAEHVRHLESGTRHGARVMTARAS